MLPVIDGFPDKETVTCVKNMCPCHGAIKWEYFISQWLSSVRHEAPFTSGVNMYHRNCSLCLRWYCIIPQIAKFMGPTWGPSRSCWPQMGLMLAPWSMLSGTWCVCQMASCGVIPIYYNAAVGGPQSPGLFTLEKLANMGASGQVGILSTEETLMEMRTRDPVKTLINFNLNMDKWMYPL